MMNRAQFMEQLKKLLSDISEDERKEALDYYESYFDEAGEENEAAVIRELGSPGKVAAIIKADLNESNENYGEYTENGYRDTREQKDVKHPGSYSGDNEKDKKAQSRAERGYREPKRSNAKMILLLILLVFLSPLLVGGLGGALGILAAILLAPFLAVFVAGICMLGFLAAGVACLTAGIGICFTYPAAGLLTIGIGCLTSAAGLLILTLLVWLAMRILPKLLRKITDFCGNLLHRPRKEGREA